MDPVVQLAHFMDEEAEGGKPESGLELTSTDSRSNVFFQPDYAPLSSHILLKVLMVCWGGSLDVFVLTSRVWVGRGTAG